MLKRWSMLALTMLLVTGVWGNAWAQTGEELIAIYQAQIEAFNAHDLEQAMTYYADAPVYDYVPMPPPLTSKVEIAGFTALLFQASPDVQIIPTRFLTSDNILVTEYLVSGTHQGDFLGIPATGNSIQLPHLVIVEFEGDKIKKEILYADYATALMQLGAMPTSELPPLEPSFELPDPEPTGLPPLEADAEMLSRFNTLNLFEWIKLFRQDVVARYGSLGMIPMTREELAALMELNLLGFPDVQLEVSREVDLGEGWVLSEFVSTGTQTGPYFGIPASGNVVLARWGMLTRFDADGLVMETNIYFNNLGILMQIGVIPGPTSVLPTTWGQVKSLFQE